MSDEDQTEALQVDALQAAGCHRLYVDHGISGSARSRPALDQLLTDIQLGDALVVWKLDRLGRSTIHLLQLLTDLRAREIDFIALTQGIDTTTSVGRMLYGQLAVFAEFEREQISDRTKAGMAAARRRGVRLGRPRALSPKDTARIARMIKAVTCSLSDLAKRYQVSQATLRRTLRPR